MAITAAFQPRSAGVTVNIAVTASSANVAVFSAPLTTVPNMQVRFFNSGTNTTFVEFGTSSAVAATTSTSVPLAGNSIEVFTVPYGTTYIAAIGTSGNTLYMTPGEGP